VDRSWIRRTISPSGTRAQNRRREWPLERTRILLVRLPRLLEEIVRDVLASEDDLELAGATHSTTGLADEAERRGAEVLIVGGDDAGCVRSLLRQKPWLKVIAVAGDERSARLYLLRPERVRVGPLSPESLTAAVRRGAAVGRHSWWSR
jgi:hypothetical protein